jgi:hypothetical protein
VTLEALIKARCSAYAGLTALVGAKVYPGLLPTNPTYPAVTYHLLGESRTRVMTNTVAEIQSRVRFAALAKDDPDRATTVARQMQACWDGVGPTTLSGVTVQKCYASDVFDLSLDALATEAPIYGVGVDVEINYRPE